MAELASTQESILGPDLHIKGTITFEKSVRIHGHVEGAINGPGRVHVARDGRITGDVEATEVVIEGNINGDIVAADRVELKPTGHYQGDLRAAKLAIDAGASFTGHVTVGADAAKERAAKPANAPRAGQVTAKAG
ncbi:MAG: polymer-forming cytoskeletal protein [Planctomycetota bacterium]|nr:polymer-forming cytoskeletal protein [Planctomycetota bacterium]